jgi:hypothetical protein
MDDGDRDGSWSQEWRLVIWIKEGTGMEAGHQGWRMVSVMEAGYRDGEYVQEWRLFIRMEDVDRYGG